MRICSIAPLFFGFIFFANGTDAAISLVQATSAPGTGVASLAVPFANANTAGNLLIAFVRLSTTSQTVAVTDSAHNTYLDAVAQAQTGDAHQVHIFYASNVAGGPNTVTATFSSINNHPWLAIYEYSGLSATSPLDQTSRAQGSSASPNSGATAPTASPNELVFAATGLPASYKGTTTPGSGYTLQQQDTGTSRAANEAAAVSATGSYAGTFSLSSSTNWSAVLATFAAVPTLPSTTTTTTTTTTSTSSTTTQPPTTSTSTTTTAPPSSATTTSATTQVPTTTTTQTPPGIALVQSTAVEGSGVGSISSTFPSSNTAGNLLVAFVRLSTTSQTVTLSDTAGNAYADAVAQAQTVDGHQIHIFYAVNARGGSNTVTARFSASNNHPWLAVYEYSGLEALDRTASGQGNSTAPNTGATAPTSSANQLLFVGLGLPSSFGGSVTSGAGFTPELQDAVVNGSRAANEHRIVTSTGAYSGAFTLSTAGNWSCALATFSAVPAPPPSLVSIAVTPTNPSIAPGTTLQFTATGTMSDGSHRDVTNTATWSSSNTAVAMISSTGLASGVSNGTATIGAASGGISGATVLTVSDATVSHFEYVLPDGNMYVYDMDNAFGLVKHVSLPQTSTGIRGLVVNPAAHLLYISYGGDGGSNGNGSMLAYDLLSDGIVWNVNYPFGVDSMALTPDGRTIYMPIGEVDPGTAWKVMDAANGNVTGSIAAGAGPHNTVVSLDGTQVYMGPRNNNFLFLASTATNAVIRSMGPLVSGVRPFTINGKHTLAFTTATRFLGFQVSDTATGQVLYTVSVAGFSPNPSFQPSAYCHGISLSPDEREVWLIDGGNSYVHVFDVSRLPGSSPTQVADLALTRAVTGSKPGCAYDCLREGWLHHSLDGRYVFVGDAGDVFATSTRRPVVNLDPLYNSREMLEIDWQGGRPIVTTTRHGLGYVTQ